MTKKRTSPKTRVGKDEKCLLIQHMGRKYFTEEKHYPQLIEFSRNFDAELSVVKVNEAEIILDLEKLAACLCNPDYTPSKTEVTFEVLESRLVSKKSLTPTKAEKTEVVTSDNPETEMFNTLKSGKKLVISDIYARWIDSEGGEYQKIYNKFIKVKNQLIKDGYRIERLTKGVYAASKL